jgi:hypothetical protein
VANMVARQLVDGLLDLHEPVRLPHGQRREVGVRAGAVPVALKMKV